MLLSHLAALQAPDREVEALHLPEIRAIVGARLLSGRRIEVRHSPNVLRRERGIPVPLYAAGVHSYGGTSEYDFARDIEAPSPARQES